MPWVPLFKPFFETLMVNKSTWFICLLLFRRNTNIELWYSKHPGYVAKIFSIFLWFENFWEYSSVGGGGSSILLIKYVQKCRRRGKKIRSCILFGSSIQYYFPNFDNRYLFGRLSEINFLIFLWVIVKCLFLIINTDM